MQIKQLRAIQTRYKGYAFRSRTEARWAVFFDHMGIKWEYEPEGFELGNGLRYLPDFWLPDLCLWVEVKPGPPDDVAREKAWRLCLMSDAPLFMSEGMPDNHGTLFTVFHQSGGEVGLREHKAQAPWFEPTIYVQHPAEEMHYPKLDIYPMKKLDPKLYGKAEQALIAARGARFEFGQQGAA